VHVHPDMLRLAIRNKPGEKVILVSDSLGPAKVTDPMSASPLYMPDGKTLAGSGISITDAYNFVVSLGVDEETARGFITRNPRSFLGLSQ